MIIINEEFDKKKNVLPIKLGDMTYHVLSQTQYDLCKLHYNLELISNKNLPCFEEYAKDRLKIREQRITKIAIIEDGWYGVADIQRYPCLSVDKLFKETWFLTREEAEEKLKKLEENCYDKKGNISSVIKLHEEYNELDKKEPRFEWDISNEY